MPALLGGGPLADFAARPYNTTMAESYTVLARRYRSQNFDELVGQEAIAQTLKNAITSQRVAHAFLFTGTRGVGKTSVARILAKAINCPNSQGGQPCSTCNTCKAIARGEDMDVIEIDGASNNGVDQVRELRASAGIRPARSPYKIYIIDEVHMLSTGAFNELLKTLEEPPEHVKFIFATTDVHKVPATIISRCQRFDFKNIPTNRIAEHLTRICTQEGVQADAEALHRIARLGNGSMRDALSLLDRVLSLGEKHITEKLLEELLGKPATAAIAELVGAIAEGDAAGALRKSDALLREGMGAEQLLGEVIDFLRNLMLVSVCGKETDLLEVATESRSVFTGMAGKFDAATLVHMIALCEQVLRSQKSATTGRPLFDALMVRLAMTEQFSSISELMQGGGAAGGAQKKNELSGTALTSPEPTRQESSAPPSVFQEMKQALQRGAATVQATAATVTPGGRPRVAPPANGGPVTPPAAPVEPSITAAPTGPASLWSLVRSRLVADKNGSIDTILAANSKLVSCDKAAGEATVEIPPHLESYAQDRPRQLLEEAFSAVIGRATRVTFTIATEATARPDAVRRASPVAQRVPPELLDAVRATPIVQRIIETLGGDVTTVEILGSGNE